jgi:hypothetical protein
MGIEDFKTSSVNSGDGKGAILDEVKELIDELSKIEKEAENIDKPEEFILGLLAGEGSLMINMHKSDRYNTGIDVRGAGQITLGKEDYKILVMIHHILNIGSLSIQGSGGVTWKVQSQKECRILADWIENNIENTLFKHTKKYESYVVWEECISMIEDGEHMSKSGIKEIAGMRDDINYYSSSARTQDEIMDIVEESLNTD